MIKKHIFALLTGMLLLSSSLSAQLDTGSIWRDNKLVQFSGVVVTADSLIPLPFVNIYDKGSGRGTVSDYYGFFSFVAMKGDTIVFSHLGFKKSYYVIPDTLSQNRYSLIQMMQTDTTWLPPAVVYPWPSKEQFARAFVELELPDDYISRAERNMQLAERKAKSNMIQHDSEMAYRQAMMNERYKLYYAGQLPASNLLNPVAWYKFVEAWKNGDFKRQD